ncbi:MAG: hypothetical protein KDJ27_21280 [Gammaproteobacteria bacterium]|nr:hypothetical protein [Gammaproteobacteria bacterium]MCB1926229.1 hypothetical protein [Gammaproteobacteria bacterium]
MATLKVLDLSTETPLDRRTLKHLRGGMSFGWIRPYQEPTAAPPFGIFINELNVYNILLANPVFNSVNQVAYNFIDASGNTDSDIQIAVNQGQKGFAG